MGAIDEISDIVALARLALSDPGKATWSDETLADWVEEGLRDYAAHFQATGTYTEDCEAGVHEYELPSTVLGIIQVEYPLGEDPPEYLSRLSRRDPRFWSADTYYDVEPSHRQGEGPTLFLSADTAATEDFKVTYSGQYYDYAATVESTTVEVPDNHIPIIVMYVQWKAAVERLFNEMRVPGGQHDAVVYSQTAQNARTEYERAIKTALATRAETRTAQWTMDHHDRIY